MERMNLRWANGLRVFVLLMPLLGGGSACAQGTQKETASVAGVAVVREIRVVKEDGNLLITNPSAVTVKTGEPLNRDDVAASIRSLYQTGDYADIQAIVTREENGVRLDFVVRENLFINRVAVDGVKPPPTEASAVGAMQLSLGQTYHPADIQDAVGRLKDTLQSEGLYQAKITVEELPHPETHQMDVIAHVDPGPRVHLGNVQLLNNTEYRDGELLKLFKLKPASEITTARLQSGMDRIRKFMEKKGHLSVRVSLRRGDFNEAS